MTLKEKIVEKALELGINKIGFAALDHTVPAVHLDQWLDQGFHADMLWMEKYREKRLDPRLLMEGAKSILCVAINYYNLGLMTSTYKVKGPRFSRYVWGKDYHIVLKEKLDQLLLYIQSLVPEVKGRIFVDTGPIMEKYWAQYAGIGWIGKNGNLITREYGSWVFLGEILLNIEIEPDEPHKNYCGNCTQCIQACPTKALVQIKEDPRTRINNRVPLQEGIDIAISGASSSTLSTPNSRFYTVDSNRCISYWTIEYRGEKFPEEIQKNLDGWVYGCDICQEVCPWNLKFSRTTIIPEFRPNSERVGQSLEVMENWTEEDYKRIFMKSAVKRVKYSGLMRNLQQVKIHHSRSFKSSLCSTS